MMATSRASLLTYRGTSLINKRLALPRTLQYAYAQGPTIVLRGWRFLMCEVPLYGKRSDALPCSPVETKTAKSAIKTKRRAFSLPARGSRFGFRRERETIGRQRAPPGGVPGTTICSNLGFPGQSGQLDGHQPLLLAHLKRQTFTYMDFVETCFYGDSYRGISPIRSSPPLLGPPYDSRYSPSAGC